MRNLHIKIVLVFVSIFISTLFSRAQSIPHYELNINQSYLNLMNADPYEEVYYPAVFIVGGVSYNVEARYKGSSTLDYPKKSWAIKFENTLNPFLVTRINLHADYNDVSAMRNFLILRLCAHLGLPAPTIQHVTYQVNGQNWGVYTQTEQIDEFFLTRNGRTALALYKGTNHGANLAPLVNDSLYRKIWEIEGGNDLSYNNLRLFLNKLLYLPKDQFDSQIDGMIDTEEVLNLYAILFTFVEFDNFTKNTWINKNSNSLKYELLPWDNEGSFGNGALGDFDSTTVNYNFETFETPEYALLLQRLLENPTHKASFQQKVNQVLTDGYPFLDSLIDSTYVLIQDEVYNDPNKKAQNADFDSEQARLKWFMTQRKLFLESNILPERNPLTFLGCDNPLPSPSNPWMTIRVKSPVIQSVRLVFTDSVDYENKGMPIKVRSVVLYDDGAHGDSLANDLIYGNTIDSRMFVSPLVHFVMVGGGQNYPANSLFYVNYYRTKSLAVNTGNTNTQVAQQIKIDKVHAYGTNHFVQIVNLGNDTIDLSYCHLRTMRETDDFMFKEKAILLPFDTVIVAATKEMSQTFFPNKQCFGNLYFSITSNDSLRLLSPMLTPMDTVKVAAVETLSANAFHVLFTEINYSSSSAHNTKDWVEIYNAGTNTVDLSGWIFRDGDNDHAFVLRNGFELQPGAYLVLSEDSTAIKSFNPGLSNVVGNIDFGLSASGEFIRLYDNLGNIVDSVDYKSISPWPTGAKGLGPTLELLSPLHNNILASSWIANSGTFGTPGLPNNGTVTSTEQSAHTSATLYPNPSHGAIYYNTDAASSELELYTIGGMLVDNIKLMSPTQNKEVFNLSAYPAGVYLVRVLDKSGSKLYKVILVK